MQTPYESPHHAYRASADVKNFVKGSTVATEPKILFWWRLYALHSGDAVSPQQFELYSGAPCPICYEDLGVNVPKGTSLILPSRPARKFKEQNSQLKTMGESSVDTLRMYNGGPHLVCLQKTGLDKNTSRLPTREATV
jgi:hypothetical protein